MFQPKARRVVPVVALTAALSLLPLADASAARARAAQRPAGISLLMQIQAQLASLWEAVEAVVGLDAGPRMDDNG